MICQVPRCLGVSTPASQHESPTQKILFSTRTIQPGLRLSLIRPRPK